MITAAKYFLLISPNELLAMEFCSNQFFLKSIFFLHFDDQLFQLKKHWQTQSYPTILGAISDLNVLKATYTSIVNLITAKRLRKCGFPKISALLTPKVDFSFFRTRWCYCRSHCPHSANLPLPYLTPSSSSNYDIVVVRGTACILSSYWM